MIYWSYSIENQEKIYKLVLEKLKNFDFFQSLNFYVLPYMPQKFRGRVLYLPKLNNSKKLFSKHNKKINSLQNKWINSEKEFIKKIRSYFTKIDSVDIYIEPSLYGTIGSYDTKYDNSVYIYPRYDRRLIDVQKLLINALTHYFMFDSKDDMNESNKDWIKKQKISKEIQEDIFPNHKYKSMTEILDRQFSGKLAEESIKYLQELGFLKLKTIDKPNNLTRSESELFDLLLLNKNKIVSFDKIADCIWKDKSIDKYSEYAITKLIERFKKKLPKHSVHTQRGVGYILISS